MPPDHAALIREVPTFDGLRLAVQYRLSIGDGEPLAMVTGVSLPALRRFAETGVIDARDRIVLEAFQ